jgi:hypothetical protein
MGIVELDKDKLLLTIRAHIVLYGDAANEVLALQVADEIETHWNAAMAEVFIRNHRYAIIFRITAAYEEGLTPNDVYENDNPLNNYFRVEEFSEIQISFVDGIGSNTGYFKLDNLLNNSTTAAHEFGHTLGLEHPENLDIRGTGAPGIMYPRGTLVDPHFQYDPAAAPASVGGTMNPYHRKVSQQDINDLGLHRLSFDKKGRAVVGAFSSLWHRKHLPR